MASNSMDTSHHVVLFPFMSKGHTIPILGLARLLLLRPGITVTVFTTPANSPFISKSLTDTTASIIELPFPQNIPEIPPGVESTDKLPSISFHVPFTRATKLMQADFERALEAVPRVSFMVSDGFLWWTLDSANKFGFPRFVFYGMCGYANCVFKAVFENRLMIGPKSDDELITVPPFPWIKVTRNDFEPPFNDPEPKGPFFELFMDQIISTENSYGQIVNSFYELEPTYVDHWNSGGEHKKWCVGPLNLAEPPGLEPGRHQKPTWIQWLDQKWSQGSSVLYVAFGSQAEISGEQQKEIAKGLEESNVNFLWVIRRKEAELGEGYEERVGERGIVVMEWVDQNEILKHQSVKGFLSHCGWNSVLESICAGVPILAWPMMAEQHVNARMVVEELKIGLRVETCNGSVRGFVKWQGLEKMVRELMEGEMGKEARKKVKEFAEMAKAAFEEGSGSSRRTLDMLIDEICNATKMS
ncbi:UDPGT domain-containing protein [Cephalotus follicularis]|uniref:Glycosyltransferase n=1 Tax=Cephalotus follicularis TaxID=3775 RepID=A0A1Q3BX67_CEPFO|nr:UDPGT domain-containing protein [Cephalotus follicularis]